MQSGHNLDLERLVMMRSSGLALYFEIPRERWAGLGHVRRNGKPIRALYRVGASKSEISRRAESGCVSVRLILGGPIFGRNRPNSAPTVSRQPPHTGIYPECAPQNTCLSSRLPATRHTDPAENRYSGRSCRYGNARIAGAHRGGMPRQQKLPNPRMHSSCRCPLAIFSILAPPMAQHLPVNG
jgi:hypothetical protein